MTVAAPLLDKPSGGRPDALILYPARAPTWVVLGCWGDWRIGPMPEGGLKDSKECAISHIGGGAKQH